MLASKKSPRQAPPLWWETFDSHSLTLIQGDMASRRETMRATLQVTSTKAFKENQFASACEMSRWEEAFVCLFFLVIVGGPLALTLLLFAAFFVGSWSQVGLFAYL